MASDIVQVSMGDRSIGIVGLKKVMTDLAVTASGKTDGECREILYRGIADQNYIPLKMVEEYKDALLLAFKVFTGQAAEPAPAGGVRIQVLGPGCFNCDRMTQIVREVLAELKIPGGDLLPCDETRRNRKIRGSGRPGPRDQRTHRLRGDRPRPQPGQAVVARHEGLGGVQGGGMTG